MSLLSSVFNFFLFLLSFCFVCLFIFLFLRKKLQFGRGKKKATDETINQPNLYFSLGLIWDMNSYVHLVFGKLFTCVCLARFVIFVFLQWRASDTDIIVSFGENTELKHSPFRAWSRSVYSHTCCAYCQGFLPYFYRSCLSTCIFFQNLSRFFPALAVANTGSCVGPQNKIGHPVGCRSPCWVPAEYK